jgi:hypothetical protein
MSEQDKDTVEQGEPNEFVPGDEEFEEDLGASDEAESGAPLEPSKPGRRFGFGREAKEEARPQGSVKAVHERVHVDDRASAIFALICAVGLVAILLGSYAAGMIPVSAGPTLAPLTLQVYSPPPATPTPVATATPVASATPTPTPTATPTASPSPTPTASPTPTPTPAPKATR